MSYNELSLHEYYSFNIQQANERRAIINLEIDIFEAILILVNAQPVNDCLLTTIQASIKRNDLSVYNHTKLNQLMPTCWQIPDIKMQTRKRLWVKIFGTVNAALEREREIQFYDLSIAASYVFLRNMIYKESKKKNSYDISFAISHLDFIENDSRKCIINCQKYFMQSIIYAVRNRLNT